MTRSKTSEQSEFEQWSALFHQNERVATQQEEGCHGYYERLRVEIRMENCGEEEFCECLAILNELDLIRQFNQDHPDHPRS